MARQPFDKELQRAQRHRDQQRPLPVRPDAAGMQVLAQMRQEVPRKPQPQHAERHVHVEHRPPAQRLRHPAAQRRADGVGDAERGTQQDLPAQAHPRIGKQVGNASVGRADQHAAADALQRPRPHQERHAARHAAHHRGQRENDDGRHHERLAAVEIPQPAEDRYRHHRGQQVGRRHPGVEVEPLEFRHHRRQRGADHGLVQRHQHDDEADAEHGQQRLPERQDLGVGMRERGVDGHGNQFETHQSLMSQSAV